MLYAISLGVRVHSFGPCVKWKCFCVRAGGYWVWDGYLRPYIRPGVALGPCNYQASMGRCVIFAQGEMLIWSCQQPPGWMSLAPRLTFHLHQRQTGQILSCRLQTGQHYWVGIRLTYQLLTSSVQLGYSRSSWMNVNESWSPNFNGKARFHAELVGNDAWRQI